MSLMPIDNLGVAVRMTARRSWEKPLLDTGAGQEDREAPRRHGALRMARSRALIVEDDPAQQRFLLEVLRQLGVDARVAPSLAVMDVQLRSSEFDVVFLDVQLGDGNSLDHLPALTMGQV